MSDDPMTERRPGQILLGWWSTYLGARENSAQKTLSARLRRGDDVTVLCQPEVHLLAQELGLRDGARLARLARLLAHVRTHVPRRLPQILGQKPGKDAQPPLSRLRFERLIQSSDEDLETALRRALPMAGQSCNVAHLGESVLMWSDRTRTTWCFDYYGAPAPDTLISEDISQ
ncbi:type I-E CRISPR-associated protein Cse2/CasB [Thioclava sp. GXIMD4215]|uniref:type I-E CRISPR-associated protein Cse2/CasB n=1 Tax=Thioclava sp. GXIMD4215 TaxID=3131928 RepID=UPI00311AF56C